MRDVKVWICMVKIAVSITTAVRDCILTFNFVKTSCNESQYSKIRVKRPSHVEFWRHSDQSFWVLSRFMQKLIQHLAWLDHGLHRILSSYWLAHFHLMKKSAKMQLYFGFGLRNDGIFYLQAAIQRTIDISPAFLEHRSAKKITVWAPANREPNKQEH